MIETKGANIRSRKFWKIETPELVGGRGGGAQYKIYKLSLTVLTCHLEISTFSSDRQTNKHTDTRRQSFFSGLWVLSHLHTQTMHRSFKTFKTNLNFLAFMANLILQSACTTKKNYAKKFILNFVLLLSNKREKQTRNVHIESFKIYVFLTFILNMARSKFDATQHSCFCHQAL